MALKKKAKARPDAGGAGAGAAPRGQAAGKRDGGKGRRDKKEKRKKSSPEDDEIKELEARIAAEAPRAGRPDFGAGKAKEQQADGPVLTREYFRDLPLSQRTKKGLEAGGFKRMTEIQRGAIPRALAGRDILGEARTGSGKTLAFLVPLIELLFRQRWSQMDGLGGLVVSPTRELAYQIFRVLTNLGSQHELSAGCIVGGRSLEEEQSGVRTMSILVATPGRLLQHLDESPGFEVGGLLMLVFDEADRILDFGFQEKVDHILGHLPAERQTLLFSATLRASVQRLGRAALRSPEVVSVHQGAKSQTPAKLQQVFMITPLEHKVNCLFSFMRTHSQKKMIVFVSSCKQVRFFYEAFRKLKPGPAVMELHGRQSLTKRLVTFQEFTERERAVALLCTDIAARGVDFPAVDWVVQMDCPDTVDSYIHRVGRTARYQSSGRSALFLLPSEQAFTAKLAAARIDVKSISMKKGKLIDIKDKLMALLAEDGAVKHLAQKAFTSYVRSIMLMRDKDVFDVQALPREEFAQSLGLVDPPDLGDLGAQADLEKNPEKRKKNQTAIQRLKERIKQKKQARKEGAAGAGEGEASDEEAELKEDLEMEKAKKLGRWERRQQRIQRAAAAGSAAAGAAPQEEEDDLLQLVNGAGAAAAPAPTALRQKKLKLRDGKAVGAQGKHVFFTGAEARAAGELAALAEELQEQGEEPAVASGDRRAFLRDIARDLASRDTSDAARARARIHERHQKQKRRERQERGAGGDSGDDVAVELATASEGEGEGASPSASPSPPRARPPASKRRRLDEAAGGATAGAAGGGPDDGDDPLGALERQALGRLGGASLFS